MGFRLAALADTKNLWDFFLNHQFTEEGIDFEDFELFVQKMYFENPLRKHYQIVAEENGKPVAHEAIIPLLYKFKEKTLVLGLGSNTLIHEEKRDMFLFFQMQNYFFSNYSKSGIDFTYGLVTRPDVLKVHLRTGYKKVGAVHVYARPIKLQKIISKVLNHNVIANIFNIFSPFGNLILRFIFNGRKKYQVLDVDSFAPSWDQDLSAMLSQFEIIAIRNSEILNWRFKSLPYRKYKISVVLQEGKLLGYIVYRKMKMQELESVAIVDFMALHNINGVIPSLLKRVQEFAFESNVDLIATIANETNPYLKDLKSCLFLKTPESFTLVADQRKDLDIKIKEDLFPFWYINWFDHDFV
ncbi:hypothetical protein LPTSP4_03480 [Leptospira ryugenii]|uniref:Uncharacterized protein n=1 Tax=Leptospira ryugenii TaxID=1917863 RepID=A0A2P2DW35_9LEPT|nr:hypothetical protein [Leptospira ryugenii]GBF48848.1 hypothetical protein LPTSP4_03480 [Leptospira ryugenii]